LNEDLLHRIVSAIRTHRGKAPARLYEFLVRSTKGDEAAIHQKIMAAKCDIDLRTLPSIMKELERYDLVNFHEEGQGRFVVHFASYRSRLYMKTMINHSLQVKSLKNNSSSSSSKPGRSKTRKGNEPKTVDILGDEEFDGKDSAIGIPSKVLIANPSKRPELSSWKRRGLGKWTASNFLGFYASGYVEAFGYEDASLQVNKRRLNTLAARVKQFAESRLPASGVDSFDREGLKAFIEWAIKWGSSEKSSWMQGDMNAWLVFDTKKAYVFGCYRREKSGKVGRRSDKDGQERGAW